MKMEWKDCWRLVLSGLLLYLAIHYWSVLADLAEICVGASAPLILGFVLAYMVNIPMTFFERKLKLEQRFPKLGSGAKPLYVLLTLAAVGGVLALVGQLVVPDVHPGQRLGPVPGFRERGRPEQALRTAAPRGPQLAAKHQLGERRETGRPIPHPRGGGHRQLGGQRGGLRVLHHRHLGAGPGVRPLLTAGARHPAGTGTAAAGDLPAAQGPGSRPLCVPDHGRVLPRLHRGALL